MVSVFWVIKFLYFKWSFNDRMTVIKSTVTIYDMAEINLCPDLST